MTAREDLLNGLLTGPQHWMAAGEDPDEANALIDAYAHELAEQIRGAGCQEINWCGCPIAADLIDPETS